MITTEKLHAAICQAVALMNVSAGVAGCKEGRQAHNTLRQALVEYADDFMNAPVPEGERSAIARKHQRTAK